MWKSTNGITDHFPQFMILKNSHVTFSNLNYFFMINPDLTKVHQIDVSYLENSDLVLSKKCNRFLKNLNSFTN